MTTETCATVQVVAFEVGTDPGARPLESFFHGLRPSGSIGLFSSLPFAIARLTSDPNELYSFERFSCLLLMC